MSKNATNEITKQKPASDLPRLAFSLRETAQMLGLSYITVYRLVQRKKLRTCGAVRHRLVTKIEIDRFLNETQEAA